MIDERTALAAIAAMTAVTFALRALPFVATRWLQRHAIVRRLGQFLPLAIMTLLVVHAAAGAAREHAAGPWFELISIAIVVVLQWTRRNALLSIAVGTAVYVALRNLL